MNNVAMTASQPRNRRPARFTRWAASGLTAAVAVGSVGAMAQENEATVDNAQGVAFGATTRYRGEVTAAEMMAAADAGESPAAENRPLLPRPPRIGSAGVS